MNIGVYQSAASLSALERWQDAVSQNISSSQVPGYRGRTVNISAVDNGQFMVGANGQSTSDSSQPASFPTATNGVSFKPGETQPTGRSLDFAIQGSGFFQVQMPDGTTAYTRNGSFTERSDGTLVNSSNYPVLGETARRSSSPRRGPVTVTQDGAISQGENQVGKIGVTTFSNTSGLVPISGGLLVAGPSAGPSAATQPGVLQGYIESSNVSPLYEMVNLVQVSRIYEANQRVITNADQQTQKTMDALG
jgi:flagellar basal-body rod protein FlgF